MEIILENIHTDIIHISDLGVELQVGESLDLLENYTRDEILKSEDLESIYDNGYISFSINSTISSLVQVIRTLTGMTEIEHESIDTLKHSLSEQSFFQVERDINDDVEKIVYYKDSTLATKIREDEIVRDVDGDVVQMIKRQYDANGTTVKTEIQTINRVDGDVASIETVTT